MRKNIIKFKKKPKILTTFTICGPKEAKGSIGQYIHKKLECDKFGEDSFEKAERKMLTYTVEQIIKNSKYTQYEIDAIISGDLLNQIISASFMARNFNVPYLGVYNACSTMSESMILGATLVDGGYFNKVICVTGSHFATAERQYRYPLEFGALRPPQAQWTVTGAGGCLITHDYKLDLPKLDFACIGRVVDYGVSDVNNMGAAMAPAAMDTLFRLFQESNTTAKDYDLIVTGDLGAFGSRVLKHLMLEKGYDISSNHVDCGEMIYNIKEDEFQGGSGAGCSAVVFNSYIYSLLKEKKLKKVIFMATGALLSTVSSQQGDTVPGIAHAIVVES